MVYGVRYRLYLLLIEAAMDILNGAVIQGSLDSTNTHTIIDNSSRFLLQNGGIFESYLMRFVCFLFLSLLFFIDSTYATVFNIYGDVKTEQGSFFLYGNVLIQVVKPVHFAISIETSVFLGIVEFINVGNDPKDI